MPHGTIRAATLKTILLEEGALFYGMPRRRQVVEFDGELRKLTLESIRGAREMIAAGQTPPARFKASPPWNPRN
jgi:CRISPR/Cas system-associated exonuclease Cas4 (RecB family)